MRVSGEEKEKSKQRIIRSAAKLVRERGIEGTSVADVMQDAGMTHGGFYRHFETKEEMLGAGISEAFAQVTGLTRGLQQKLGQEVGHQEFRKFYLSLQHRKEVGAGCPVAALGTELARVSEPMKESFEQGLEGMLAVIAEAKPGRAADKRKAAIQEMAMLVGAMVMARACDEPKAKEILRVCLEKKDEGKAA